MHSLVSRINNVSALLSSCLMGLLVAIALSSFVFPPDIHGDVGIVSVKLQSAKARKYPYSKQEAVSVNFNISAGTTSVSFPEDYDILMVLDLSSLFHWNTKQLFVYLEAEYENTNGISNNVVIWDKIIQRKQDSKLQVVGKNKYTFREPSKSFKNLEPAHYSLKYNVMPYVGLLTYGEAARTADAVEFPVKAKS
ncbi:signal peptidase subunit [Flagelloscypha sp. PMI_526]|nr:signal peptidase subunit [Flagelloscypha sp. PMI_526]